MTDSDLEFLDEDDETVVDERFTSAAAHVQLIHAKLEPDELLELYALYKQATLGSCNTPKPSIFQLQARTKWTAWQSLGDVSKAEAQRLYVLKVKQLDDSWEPKANSTQKSAFSWVVHSVEQPPEDAELCKPEYEKTASDYVKEKNLSRLREVLNPAEDLPVLDAHGMALIHWAADRNATDILAYLLSAGADVDQRDLAQQTPLHYAASCGHVDALRMLLSYKADHTLCDEEGQTSLDVADNEDVREILLALVK